MRRLLILALLLLPLSVQARPKGPSLIEPLVAELTLDPANKDQAKAIKAAERCLDTDSLWERAQENNDPISQVYESLTTAVTCWQGAEKKAAKAGEAMGSLPAWVSARARYLESFRSFVWALDAKFAGNQTYICKRLQTARVEGAAAVVAAENLVDRFGTNEAKALAAAQEATTAAMAQNIADEFAHQKCK
jgi:hypothetical protein